LTTVQGIPTKFDQKKILKVIKKKFACNGTIVNDEKMGEVIQLQGDQRKDVEKFLVDKDDGLDIDAKTIKVSWKTQSSGNAWMKIDATSRSTVSKLPYAYPARYPGWEAMAHQSRSSVSLRLTIPVSLTDCLLQ